MTVATQRGYYVASDLVTMPNDGQRYEIIDGSLSVTPMAGGNRQRVVGELFRQLAAQCPAGRLVLPGAQIDAGPDAPIPDLLIVADMTDLPAAFAPAAVWLVLEVTSPRQEARDWVTKRALYARLGIQRYVIAEPGSRLSVLQLAGDGYEILAAGRTVAVPGLGTLALA